MTVSGHLFTGMFNCTLLSLENMSLRGPFPSLCHNLVSMSHYYVSCIKAPDRGSKKSIDPLLDKGKTACSGT